jgi:hypothetical protein
VVSTIGVLWCAASPRSARMNSMPFMSGIRRSSSTASNGSGDVASSSIACLPFSACPSSWN